MTWPQPARHDHEKFCGIEEWQRVRDARGRTGTHHAIYELHLPDGGILRTRISHPVDRSAYGPGIWGHILRDQLQVSEVEFWRCLREGVTPARGRPEVPAGSLPADVVHLLISRVGLAEIEVAAMSREDALARLQRHWTEGG